MSNHRFNLAELAGELSGAFASVLVRSVTTGAPVLAHMVCTVVNVCRAVRPDKARKTLAGEVSEVVFAAASILARVGFDPCAEGNLLFAVAPLEPGWTLALVGSHLVDAGPVVLASVVQTVVDVLLASHSGKAWRALTPEKGRVYEIGGVGLVGWRHSGSYIRTRKRSHHSLH